MNELQVEEKIIIEDLIYEIRGKQVMLDSDLARLYKCTNGTKDINKAVKRNINRFPKDFYFQLTEDEYVILKFQIGTSKVSGRGGVRKLPYVFTEQGVAMLSSVLHTEIAETISVRIMRAFVKMKKYISNNLLEQKYYNDMTIRHDFEIKILQESFNKLEENKEVNEIYFDGKIYDAYSKVKDIFKESKKELIIVDRYTDKTLLDMVKDLKCNVLLITSTKTNITKLDLNKYNKTYNNLKIYYNDLFHDRYIIIDKDKIYHSGNSINHVGFRKSSIDVISDKNVKNQIMKDINSILTKD